MIYKKNKEFKRLKEIKCSKIILLLFFVLFIFTTIFSCTKTQTIQSESFLALGTICDISLFESGVQENYDAIVELVNEIEKKVSVNILDSEISKINNLSGEKPIVVSEDTYELIETALKISKETNGAFNLVLGPIISLWNIGSENPYLPQKQEIDNLLSLTNYDDLILDKKNMSVFLKQKGMKLNLGGIAKGFVADKIKSKLKELNIERAIINLGGNVLVVGEKKDSGEWGIGIRNPLDGETNSVVMIKSKETSVVTSGIYERFFIKDNIRYHHIFDSKTGYPVDNDLLSVSIITKESTIADAYSTGVFVLGIEKGMEFVENLPQIEAIFITKDLKVICTSGIKNKVEILDKNFYF